MLSGVMLIIVTMFAVLGAYFLSDVLTECIFKKNSAPKVIVVLAGGNAEQVWNSVVDAKTKMPDTEIIVLCNEEPLRCQEVVPSLRGVSYASADNLNQVIGNKLYAHLQTQREPI